MVDPTIEPGATAYSQLSVDWWRLMLSIPAATNPITDPDGSECERGRFGPVVFLAGNTGGKTTRSCTIDAGRALMFPLINLLAVNGPGETKSAEELTEDADAVLANTCQLELRLDGTPVDMDLEDLRVTTGAFDVDIVEDGVFGNPPGNYDPAISDGFWALMTPLQSGEHRLEYGGSLCDPDSGSPFFTTSLVYNLTVE